MEKCRILQSGNCEITCGFAQHQARKRGKQHIYGVDVVSGGYTLSSVVAHSDGTVVRVIDYIKEHELDKTGCGFGNQVIIRHLDDYCTIYSHLLYNSIKVKVGDTVKAGDVIGMMGNTGSSTGCHTDFSVIELVNNSGFANLNLVTDIDTKFVYLNPEHYLGNDLPYEKSHTDSLCRVQTGAFSNKNNADKMADELRGKGYTVCIKYYNHNYHVQVGAYSNKVYATAMALKLKLAGYSTFITNETGVDC